MSDEQTVYIGIDPGLSGALAAIYPGGAVEVHDVPTLDVGRNGKVRREYNTWAMGGLLMGVESPPGGRRRLAIIEAVHAMPGQGVRSMFTLGYGLGVWEGLLAGHGIRYERVTPQRWKRALMDGMGKDKDAARLVAMRLFPELADQLKRKKDDGRAEALLLAEFGRRVARAGE